MHLIVVILGFTGILGKLIELESSVLVWYRMLFAFIILLLKPYYKYIWLLLLFPLFFGYSRIYLGVHYPIDILVGYMAGVFFGSLFYLLQKKLRLTKRFQ